MFFLSRLRPVALALTLTVAFVPAAVQADGQITQMKQALAEAASVDDTLSAFYRAASFEPVWVGPEAAERRAALFEALSHAGDHGLPAAKYDLSPVIEAARSSGSPRDLGTLDVAFTKLYLAYAHDLQSGLLVPREVDAGLLMDVRKTDSDVLLKGILGADPAAYLRSLAPQDAEYARLMKARFDLQHALDTGAWGPEVPERGYDRDSTGEGVIALRNRLIAMGYLPRTASTTYDDQLARAVQSFQADNGITADGIAGEATVIEINRKIEDRLASVLVALERERWMNFPRGDRHVWVNLADFTAQIRDKDVVTLETRAVVGANQPDRRSPEFSDQMELLVINPSWSVPRSITVKEYLPMLQRNPNAAGHLRIVDRNGRTVSRSAVDFTAYTAGNFPFAMSQPPSDGNALGKVKFLFPNSHNIYLHDTPAKDLFGREVRAFSHGCIRLGRPFDFAYEILSRQVDDPKGFFHATMDTGAETPVQLDHPIPVHLTYRTAFTSAKGHLQFRRDIYGRDGRIFEALKAAGVTLSGESSQQDEG